jgi:hypothetical protein
MSKIREVDMFQIIQKKINKSLEFYIIPNSNYTLVTEQKLIQEIKNRLGEIEITIKKVNIIERDKNSNKLKTVSLI